MHGIDVPRRAAQALRNHLHVFFLIILLRCCFQAKVFFSIIMSLTITSGDSTLLYATVFFQVWYSYSFSDGVIFFSNFLRQYFFSVSCDNSSSVLGYRLTNRLTVYLNNQPIKSTSI